MILAPLVHPNENLWLPRLAVLLVPMCLLAAPLPAQTTDQQSASSPGLATLVEAQRRAIEEQKQTLEAQKREIEELRKQFEETQALLLSTHNRLEELSKTAPDATVGAAVQERLAKIEEATRQIPDVPKDVVSAGDFPGSIRIPGSDVALRIGGLVRTTGVATLGPLGTEDRFVTSSIPVKGSPEAGKQPRFVMSSTPSRFNLDLRTPTGVGAMRAFIEGDFGGPSRTFRLRHAYGQWQDLVVGQTWSTFADPDAEPDGIDFEGLNAIALFRQPLMRYSHHLSDSRDLAIAVENPAPDITNARGVSQIPDLVVRARWRPGEEAKGLLGMKVFRKNTHVSLALLFRQISGEPLDQPNTTHVTSGYGVGLSGRLTAPWQQDKGQVTFSTYAGRGIGRYITDLGTLGGQDAVYDSTSRAIEALPVYAWYFGYERTWTASLRSTFTYGIVIVDNLAVQPSNALRQTNRASVNLTWSPIPRLDLVAEFLFGNRINKDRARGSSSQLQLGTSFRF